MVFIVPKAGQTKQIFASPQTLSPPFGAGSGDDTTAHVALSVAREGEESYWGMLTLIIIIIILSNDDNVFYIQHNK